MLAKCGVRLAVPDTDWLKSVDQRQSWYIAIAAGVVIMVAAIAKSSAATVLIGLAFCSVGFGESINHPLPPFTVVKAA